MNAEEDAIYGNNGERDETWRMKRYIWCKEETAQHSFFDSHVGLTAYMYTAIISRVSVITKVVRSLCLMS